jgi:hypothetical protein
VPDGIIVDPPATGTAKVFVGGGGHDVGVRNRIKSPPSGYAPTDFFRGFLTTSLAEDELLTEIRVPKITVLAGRSKSSTVVRRIGRSLVLLLGKATAPPVLVL